MERRFAALMGSAAVVIAASGAIAATKPVAKAKVQVTAAKTGAEAAAALNLRRARQAVADAQYDARISRQLTLKATRAAEAASATAAVARTQAHAAQAQLNRPYAATIRDEVDAQADRAQAIVMQVRTKVASIDASADAAGKAARNAEASRDAAQSLNSALAARESAAGALRQARDVSDLVNQADALAQAARLEAASLASNAGLVRDDPGMTACPPSAPTSTEPPSRIAKTPWPLKPFVPDLDTPSDWIDGRLVRRGCQIAALQALSESDGGLAALTMTNRRAGELSRLYFARAGRQQIWMDLASWGVQLGGIGALASHGAGKHTQQDWGYGALAMVLISQFNAYQPTKDLYYGGSVGALMIRNRYKSIHEARTEILAELQQVDEGPLRADCERLDAQLADVESWDHSAADFAVIEPEVRRIRRLCDSTRRSFVAMRSLAESPAISDGALARLEASDLYFFDLNMVKRDRDLRATPLQTLTALAAAPLQAATTILTGDDARRAIDGLRTQQAISNLDQRLGQINQAGLSVTLPGAVTLADSVYTQRFPKDGRKDAAAELAYAQTFDVLERTVDSLNDSQAALSNLDAASAAIRYFVSADRLKFVYDANTALITVSVDPPPAQQPQAATTQVDTKNPTPPQASAPH